MGAALYSVKVLRDRGVAFHVVVPVDDLGLTNKDAKTVKQIVGFDSDHVYLLSDAKKKVLEGNTELHNALTYSNNIWIPIALDSYGATYIAQNFIDAKSSGRKQFLQVFSRRIAESLEAELHEDCTCHVSAGIYPFSECKVTSRKEREPLAQIKASKGGVKG
uniref:Apolipophorin-like protein n=1 Tax=Coptotermes formosanus TaxID=36987 RepID=L0AUF0_COPFO|nr:apolipophorin-like protein [Coptotermes formosanus]